MSPTESELEKLGEALGNELKVGVDGKVELKPDAPESKETPKEDEGNKELETKVHGDFTLPQLIENHDILQQFASQILTYSTINPKTGEREWDFPVILKEAGYDPNSLKKLGEAAVNSPTNNPNGAVLPATDPLDSLVTKMQDNPKEFLKGLFEQFNAELQKKVSEEIKPLREESTNRRVSSIVDTVRSAHPDFDTYKVQIGQVVQRMNVKTAEDLENIYFAVKARTEAANQEAKNKGTGSSTGTAAGSGPKKPTTPEEEIFASMMNAGQRPDKADNLKSLFGKTSLAPFSEVSEDDRT